MKIHSLSRALTLVGALVCIPAAALADGQPVAAFTQEAVAPVTIAPRSTVLIATGAILSPVNFTFNGVVVRPTGPSGVFKEVIIEDLNGKILGTSNVLNQQGNFTVKFTLTAVERITTGISILGRTADDLGFANGKSAGLQADQFFYDGNVVTVQGEYPGGQDLVDSSIYQVARVVFNRLGTANAIAIWPGIRNNVDQFVIHVQYEPVTLWLDTEVLTTDHARPTNVAVWIRLGQNNFHLAGLTQFREESNLAKVTFRQPLNLPVGDTTITLQVLLGSTFVNHSSAVIRFNTEKMIAMDENNNPVTVFSDLTPSSNTVTSLRVVSNK